MARTAEHDVHLKVAVPDPAYRDAVPPYAYMPRGDHSGIQIVLADGTTGDTARWEHRRGKIFIVSDPDTDLDLVRYMAEIYTDGLLQATELACDCTNIGYRAIQDMHLCVEDAGGNPVQADLVRCRRAPTDVITAMCSTAEPHRHATRYRPRLTQNPRGGLAKPLAITHNAAPLNTQAAVMHRIKTYNTISAKGLDRFERERYEVGQDIAHPDALLLRSHKLQETEILDSVTAIARAGAGVNNIPLAACSERGIPSVKSGGRCFAGYWWAIRSHHPGLRTSRSDPQGGPS